MTETGTPGADFFDDAYRRILDPFHPEEEARIETAALRELLALSQDDRVLDLGCGWGRHLRLLEEAGHFVVGTDRSVALLHQAAEGWTAPGADPEADEAPDGARSPGQPRLAAGDMRRLPFRAGSFDVVVNLATSLGLFLRDAPAVQALAEVRRVLRPGGRLLIEGMHRDDVVSQYAPRDHWDLDDGTRVRVRRRFDAVRGVSHEVLRWSAPDGSAGAKRHSLRLRTATEMVALLERAVLQPGPVLGDWDGQPLRLDSPRMILVARAG